MRLALGAAVDPIAPPQARNHSWRPGAGLSVPIQREPVKTHRTGRHDRPTASRAGLFAAACLASLPAHASFLSGEALDTAANVIALVVICIVPIVGIVLVLDGARAAGEDRAQAPSSADGRDPSRCACCRWCSAACCGRSRGCGRITKPCCTSSPTAPTSTTTTTPRRLPRPARRASAAGRPRALARRARQRWRAAERCRPSSRALRDQLAALEPRIAAQASGARRRRRTALMEVLLLGIYSFFVWLIFIKFKWLPWNTVIAGHRRHHPDRRR